MERILWQFRGVGNEVEAFVLAAGYDEACELFQAHLRVNGGDPDMLLFRELNMHHLEKDAAVAVREALGVGRNGMVTHDEIRGWVFVTRSALNSCAFASDAVGGALPAASIRIKQGRCACTLC